MLSYQQYSKFTLNPLKHLVSRYSARMKYFHLELNVQLNMLIPWSH